MGASKKAAASQNGPRIKVNKRKKLVQEWAPRDLVALYTRSVAPKGASFFPSQQPGLHDDGLLELFVTDGRMESVWRGLRTWQNRVGTSAESEVDGAHLLYICQSLNREWLETPPPSQLRRTCSRISEQASKLSKLLEANRGSLGLSIELFITDAELDRGPLVAEIPIRCVTTEKVNDWNTEMRRIWLRFSLQTLPNLPELLLRVSKLYKNKSTARSGTSSHTRDKERAKAILFERGLAEYMKSKFLMNPAYKNLSKKLFPLHSLVAKFSSVVTGVERDRHQVRASTEYAKTAPKAKARRALAT